MCQNNDEALLGIRSLKRDMKFLKIIDYLRYKEIYPLLLNKQKNSAIARTEVRYPIKEAFYGVDMNRDCEKSLIQYSDVYRVPEVDKSFDAYQINKIGRKNQGRINKLLRFKKAI